MSKEINEVALEHGCECSESKCEKVRHCVYHAAKLMLKVAAVCAICHVAKEVHKVHKAIEHKNLRVL